MSGFDWFLLAWWLFGILMLVSTIGKPRKPLEPSVAVCTILITVGLMVGLLWSRGVLS